MSLSVEELRALSDKMLIEEHDRLAQHTSVGVNYFLEELARRDATALAARVAENTDRVAGSSKRMETLTRLTAGLRAANVVAAVASVVATFAS